MAVRACTCTMWALYGIVTSVSISILQNQSLVRACPPLPKLPPTRIDLAESGAGLERAQSFPTKLCGVLVFRSAPPVLVALLVARLPCHTQLSHTTLSHTHTTWSHTHTTLSHTTLSHTTLSHTFLSHTQLCHTHSHTHNFVTHTHNFVTYHFVTHTTWSHTHTFVTHTRQKLIHHRICRELNPMQT